MVDLPLQPGTLFVLLTSGDEAENLGLRRRQEELRALTGGKPIEPVHLTCQKFTLPDESQLPGFVSGLKSALLPVRPFPVTATSVTPLYSTFRGGEILKWQIAPVEMLPRACGLIEDVVRAWHGTSLYDPGWSPTLVTALQETHTGPLNGQLRKLNFPYLLFTANRVLITRLAASEEFETLAEFPFPNQTK